MSYAVHNKVKGVDKSSLLEKNVEMVRMNITRELEIIIKNNKQLQNYLKEIGSSKDNKTMRDQTHKMITASVDLIKRCKENVENFERQIEGPDVDEKDILKRQQELMRFRNNLMDATSVFEKASKEIREKQQFYIEEAKRSMATRRDETSEYTPTYSENKYLVQTGRRDNHDEEREQVSGTYTQVMKAANEAEFMDDIIVERQKEVEQIERIMVDIHDIATDIAEEAQSQKKKLEDLVVTTGDAQKNTKKGLEEVIKADDYQKRGRKKLWIILLIILVAVGAAVGIVVGLTTCLVK